MYIHIVYTVCCFCFNTTAMYMYDDLQCTFPFQACSGKFSPLHQWFYFDALECLGESGEEVPEEAAQPQNTRYDGQIAIFGSDYQKKMENQKYFVVCTLISVQYLWYMFILCSHGNKHVPNLLYFVTLEYMCTTNIHVNNLCEISAHINDIQCHLTYMYMITVPPHLHIRMITYDNL